MPAPEEDASTNTRARRGALSLAMIAIASVMLGCAGLALLATSTWLGAMLANVSPTLALFALLVSVTALAARVYGASAVSLVASAVLIAPALTAPRAGAGASGDMRVLVFNVYAEASSHERTIAFLRETDADLVLLNECS